MIGSSYGKFVHIFGILNVSAFQIWLWLCCGLFLSKVIATDVFSKVSKLRGIDASMMYKKANKF